jgi:hypothetical protein
MVQTKRVITTLIAVVAIMASTMIARPVYAPINGVPINGAHPGERQGNDNSQGN